MGIADLFRNELEALAQAIVPFLVAELEARGVIPMVQQPISTPAETPPPSA